MITIRTACAGTLAVALVWASSAHGEDGSTHKFQRQQLTDVYFSEGVGAGDLNRDGRADVVYGPYWFAGPEFTERHEIYPPQPQNREGYADNFFSWVYDFDGDGANDVFVVGFPGTPAYVYRNPTSEKPDAHWQKHEVFDWVSNESPHFCQLVGDERPELVCTRDGHFGYAAIDWDHPLEAWTFHPISPQVADKRFGHGLGVGDVNGDGRPDVIHAGGWFEQPAEGAGAGLWPAHEQKFTDAYGGAEMHAYDVDGDGDNDIITSLAAHDFGLAWYEQVSGTGFQPVRNDSTNSQAASPDSSASKPEFRQHLIMGSKPEDSPHGVVFSELHSVALADIDGDGLKDIVTGKTYYSHHQQSPMWDAGAVVYWFQLIRTPDGVDWIPHQADGEAGIGRQVRVHDVNGDNLPDIMTGGMKGAHVLLHAK